MKTICLPCCDNWPKRLSQPLIIANKKPAEGGLEILMVAGAGFEPTTFGL